MDDLWLLSLDSQACILVPTRSLQNDLHQRVQTAQLGAGNTVWPTPSVFTWADYLRDLWSANGEQISSATQLIEPQQSRLIWERIIQRTRRFQDQLMLLNVAQTARAVQRSWDLCHDWQIDISELKDSPVEDTRQFAKWCQQYQSMLLKRSFVDNSLLLTRLLSLISQRKLRSNFSSVYWYGFNSYTNAQMVWQAEGLKIKNTHRLIQRESSNVGVSYHSYESRHQEFLSVAQAARRALEQNPALKIQIVVPDLHACLTQFDSILTDVFYAGKPPQRLQNNDLVYRYSLGQSLLDWAPSRAAICLIRGLKSHISVADFGFLIRSQFIRATNDFSSELELLEAWLGRSRSSHINFRQLPDLLVRAGLDSNSIFSHFANQLAVYFLELDTKLDHAVKNNRFRTLEFSQWREQFQVWLALWGWSVGSQREPLSSVQYQLLEAWTALLKDFEDFGFVESKIGLGRALELLVRLARDRFFLPKASNSPILVCSIFDAIGSSADQCFVVGMHERFPAATRIDPFIANQLKQSESYPYATPLKHQQQAQKVIDSLISNSSHCHISYATQDERDADITLGVSSLFRRATFTPEPAIRSVAKPIVLEQFCDNVGPALPPNRCVTGGTSLFTDQSNCAFRAFAIHRLNCTAETKTEFGLDALDRGNFLHFLMERVWQALQSKSTLVNLIQGRKLDNFIDTAVASAVTAFEVRLNDSKARLLALEQPRLIRLLKIWLQLEADRPTDFIVVGTEEADEHSIGGITFWYKIDRVDQLDDGRTVVLDYKTGIVNRADMIGDRLKQPQLPLYVQALTAKKHEPPAGVAYAYVKQADCEFIELAETGIFDRTSHHATRYHQHWQESVTHWPQQLEQLANDYLNGDARVNPIDTSTCQYCDLHPFCRVRQLRSEKLMGLISDE